MMEAWGKREGMDNGQAQTLREHLKDCVNSKGERT